VNDKTKKPLPRWLPFVAGTLLVIQFAGLGAWQLSRGIEKRATQYSYQDEVSFATWTDGQEVRPYQRLEVEGQFDTGHQIVLENIILNSRYGFYVITPLIVAEDAPVLLVNRGWIEKPREGLDHALLDVSTDTMTIRGRVGALPKPGYKMGDAINATEIWPKYAVYPSVEEVAATLGGDVQPFVLLMNHEEELGFYRHWVPTEFGPGKHFGYALQWFAMGAVLSGLLIWNYRKKRFDA
jgi:surfeit locus 1 family protein